MMDLANDSLDEETEAKMTMVINKMFKQRESGDGISFDQFKGILKEYEGELTAAQLDLNIDGEYHRLPRRSNRRRRSLLSQAYFAI